MKTAKAPAYYGNEPVGVWNEDGTPKILLRIEGLRQIDTGEFELSGVRGRDIDWQMIAKGLGETGPMADQLADVIGQAVWDYDIVQILRDRIVRTG